MPEGLPPPIPLAMVVCDAIWIDPSTGKHFLLGLFSEIAARDFPAMHPLIAVHVCMTDAEGKILIKLQLVDVDESRDPLFMVENELEFPDRRANIVMMAQLRGVVFPEPGEYRLQLFGRGELMLERRLLVKKVEG
jgi:hypothetical protein